MRRRATRQEQGESGIAIVEVVISAPLLLLFLMLVVQFGVAAHAQSVAQAAAQEGNSVGRSFDGSAGKARSRADSYLDRLGKNMVTGHSISVQRTGNTSTVTITGHALQVMPFVKIPIHETSTGPVERYVPPEPEE